MQRRLDSFPKLGLFFVAAAALVGAVAGMPACSGEGEGQRCSTTDDQGGTKSDNGGATYDSYAGSSDCSGDLWCYPASQLGGAASQYASEAPQPTNATLGICCPSPTHRYPADPVTICALQGSAGDTGFPDGGPDGAANDAQSGADSGSGDAIAPATDSGATDSAPAADAPLDAPLDATGE